MTSTSSKLFPCLVPTFVVKVPVKNKATVMVCSAVWMGKMTRMTFQCHSAGKTFKRAFCSPLSLRFGSCPDVSPANSFMSLQVHASSIHIKSFSFLVCIDHLHGCNIRPQPPKPQHTQTHP